MQNSAILPAQKAILQYHFPYFPVSKERHLKPAWLVVFSEKASSFFLKHPKIFGVLMHSEPYGFVLF